MADKNVKLRVNQVIISGYVHKDPFVNDARNFLMFNCGVDESYKNRDGSWVNNTHWIPVKVYGNTDRIDYLSKAISGGSYVLVIGRIGQSNYKNSEGINVTDVHIQAQSVQVYRKNKNTDNYDTYIGNEVEDEKFDLTDLGNSSDGFIPL